MDLIYADHKMQDQGVLHDYKLDLAYGVDENDFELTIPAAAHCCAAGFYVYVEGTEYGGIVDAIYSDTGAREVSYTGRTWHGLLNSKIVEPDAGADYLVLTGEANAVLRDLIARLGLSDLFEASEMDSGLTIRSYKMNRYIAAYDGIRKMLKTVGAKLSVKFSSGKVILSAVPRGEYNREGELDSDLVDFKVQRVYNPVNHLICLGRGELSAREVIHLYADANGVISTTQTFTGMNERATVYENTNAETLEDLESEGRDKLADLAAQDSIQVAFEADDAGYDVQDSVCATDNVTGLSVVAEIMKKIVTIESGQTTISYKVGL